MTTHQGTSRVEGSVTSISWIPSEAVEGAFKAGFKLRGLALRPGSTRRSGLGPSRRSTSSSPTTASASPTTRRICRVRRATARWSRRAPRWRADREDDLESASTSALGATREPQAPRLIWRSGRAGCGSPRPTAAARVRRCHARPARRRSCGTIARRVEHARADDPRRRQVLRRSPVRQGSPATGSTTTTGALVAKSSEPRQEGMGRTLSAGARRGPTRTPPPS